MITELQGGKFGEGDVCQSFNRAGLQVAVFQIEFLRIGEADQEVSPLEIVGIFMPSKLPRLRSSIAGNASPLSESMASEVS